MLPGYYSSNTPELSPGLRKTVIFCKKFFSFILVDDQKSYIAASNYIFSYFLATIMDFLIIFNIWFSFF